MKRIFCMALALMLLTGGAWAAVLTDAPGTPTQDRAISLEAYWLDEDHTPYDLTLQPADQLTVDNAVDVYDFTYEQIHRPARWYPEETQIAIAEMINADPDILYMTEFMRMHAAAIEEVKYDLRGELLLDIDYQIGQLTVVVLGDTTNPEDIVWTPVESRVTKVGLVEFEVPQALMEQLQGEDVIFSLLTVRPGAGGTSERRETEIPEEIPSKQAENNTRIVETVRSGETLEDDFKLIIVPETDLIRRELSMLRDYVVQQEQPAVTWLPQADQDRIRYHLHADTETVDSLIVSEYVPLITESYRDTDGDAIATLSFATPYEEGQIVISALGIPIEEWEAQTGKKYTAREEEGKETLLHWAVQPVIVRENGRVDIVFDQMTLIDMDPETGLDTGLLLILSEPPETEDEQENP